MNTIDENKPNIIRKKSSFLLDGSYRIFHITNQLKDDSDDDNKGNHNNDTSTNEQSINKRSNSITNKSRRKSLKIANQNGLKQFFFLHKSSCELSSTEAKTPPSLPRHSPNELCQPVMFHDSTPPVSLVKKSKLSVSRDTMSDRSKTDCIDEKIAYKNLLARTDGFEQTSRKSIVIPNHPELRASFHRRRKRFIVACGTVIVAASIIITIIIYVIIMTLRHSSQMNRLPFYAHPR